MKKIPTISLFTLSLVTLKAQSWSNIETGITGAVVYGLTIYNGNLYAGGGFSTAGGNTAWDIAEWSTPEILSEYSEVAVFPNPCNGQFTVRCNELNSNKIIVYNLLGEKIYDGKITSTETPINLRGKNSGLYIYKIYSENGIEVS